MATFGEYVVVNGKRLHVIHVDITSDGFQLHLDDPAAAPEPQPSRPAADDGVLEGVVQLPTWDQLTYDLEPLALELARLHRPDRDWECKGCDFGGYDAEPPDWPCPTAVLVLKHLGYDVQNTYDYGSTVVRREDDHG